MIRHAMIGPAFVRTARLWAFWGLVGFSCLSQNVALQAAEPAGPVLTVVDEAGKVHSISSADFARFPRKKITIQDRDAVEHDYEGTLLSNVLESAGIELGARLRGARLTLCVVIEAKDGYRVVCTLSELDPSNTDAVMLLADRRDGQPLDTAQGPYRLVIPAEKRHARWIRQIERLVIVDAAKK